MRKVLLLFYKIIFCSTFLLLVSCASTRATDSEGGNSGGYLTYDDARFSGVDYGSRLPQFIDTRGVKTVLVDPNVHAWGAYDREGELIRAGIATAGGSRCPPDANKATCYTGMGTFRITGLGDETCYSRKYHGGLMPYCMYFNHGEALHGSPDNIA